MEINKFNYSLTKEMQKKKKNCTYNFALSNCHVYNQGIVRKKYKRIGFLQSKNQTLEGT